MTGPAAGSTTFLAHGVGGPSDLPIPAEYAFLGAAAALLVSFVVLAFAWRTPRFRGDASGRPVPAWLERLVDSPLMRGVLVSIGLLFTAWVSMAAWFGEPILVNPTFGVVFVLLWVGLVPAALLFGNVYRLLNPLRWIHRCICAVAGIDRRAGVVSYPAKLGMWPAAAFLFAFVGLELVDANAASSLETVRLWFAVVGALLVMGATVFGDGWFAHADPFEVYSGLVARLSPFGRRLDGRLVVRNPLENLDGLPPTAGLVAVVSVLLGSTAFDSFKDTSRWLRFSQQYTEHGSLLNAACLLGFCLIVFVSFSVAAVATSGLGGADGSLRRRDVPDLLAHSLVPIVVGYIVAHYLSYFVSVGIGTVVQLGDPLSRGWTLASGLDDINKYAIYDHPTALAVTKVVAVITGHVLGVIAAHDRSLRILPAGRLLIGQLPLLVLMVAYTLTGLWLLFAS